MSEETQTVNETVTETGTSEERVARGQLRTRPDTPAAPWSPDAGTTPLGTLEQRAEAHQREEARRVQGIPGLAAAGWVVFVLGGLLYLYALWATANAVLAGASAPEQTVRFGGSEFLLGTLGLVLVVVGLLVALVFTFTPVRLAPPLTPGTLEFEVAAENLVRARMVRRVMLWSGLGLFLLGLVLAGLPLRDTATSGDLSLWELGGERYRLHLWGYLLVAIGTASLVAAALSLGALEQALPVVLAALEEGHVRRAEEPLAERSDVVAQARSHPLPTATLERAGADPAPPPTREDAPLERS